MIYISIDNDQQANLALLLIEHYKIQPEEVVFISHISPRNRIISTSDFSFKAVNIHPFCAGNSYKNPLTYVKSFFHQIKIKKQFNFKYDDTLIVTTEYELNNALFAKEVRRKGGQVYIFDEGVIFYFNNSPYHDLHVKRIDKFYLSLFNLAFKIMGIPAYAKKGLEGKMFACISDKLVDKVYSSMNLPINRQLNISGYRSILNLTSSTNTGDSDTAIIFATNFKCFNLKDEEMRLAGLAIEKMSTVFSEVLVKVHPSDYILQNDVYNFYNSLKSKYNNVKLLDNSGTAVEVINKYCPTVVVGTMSASLFEALLLGYQPIFLFHMLPFVSEFGVYKFTLDKLSYNFISSLNDISADYQSKVNISNLLYEGSPSENIFRSVGHE